MRALSSNEVETIDRFFLSKYKLDEKLKQELLDHLSCEIEEKMNETNCSFQEAFTITRSKWKVRLKMTTLGNGIPNFMVKYLMNTEFKKQFPMVLLFTVLIYSLLFYVEEDAVQTIGFYSLIISGAICFLGLVVNRWTTGITNIKINFYKIILVGVLLVNLINTSLLMFMLKTNNEEWIFFSQKIVITIAVIINYLSMYYGFKIIQETRHNYFKKISIQ